MIQQPAFKVEVVDTTGAGDCFTGGFLSQFLKSNVHLKKALKYGVGSGSLCVTRIGMETAPDKENLKKLWMQKAG